MAGLRQYLAEEEDLVKQHQCIGAIVRLREVGLLSRLLAWIQNEEWTELIITSCDSEFGTFLESALADALRAIGYLSRCLLADGRPEEATAAIDCLHQHLSRLPEAQHRSIVVGWTTALGYLGEWEPLLSHLGPGEPWMHQAAHNIFANWVSADLEERERAARWIARRLRQPELVPEVRSTLGKLLETLERQIGRHLGDDLEDEPA